MVQQSGGARGPGQGRGGLRPLRPVRAPAPAHERVGRLPERAARHRRFASPLTRRRSGPPPRTHRARLTPTAPARLQFRTAPYPAISCARPRSAITFTVRSAARARIVVVARRGRNTSTSTPAAPSGCSRTTSSRYHTSPPFANAPTRAVKPAKSACITASTVTNIRKLVMET